MTYTFFLCHISHTLPLEIVVVEEDVASVDTDQGCRILVGVNRIGTCGGNGCVVGGSCSR